MDPCNVCFEREAKSNLALAMFQGNIVDPDVTPEWAGMPVCQECFDVNEGKRLYHLIELGPYRAGTIIRSEMMTPNKAQEYNDKMSGTVIKWVHPEDLEDELEKLRRLGYLKTF
jgi:hypothetical protein